MERRTALCCMVVLKYYVWDARMLDYLLTLPIFLISLTIHEYAHGWTAYRYGDDSHDLSVVSAFPLVALTSRDISGKLVYMFAAKALSGRNSVVECQLPKLDVVGSNPIGRFFEGGFPQYRCHSLKIWF